MSSQSTHMIVLGSLSSSTLPQLPAQFVVLVPAFTDADQQRAEAMVAQWVEHGCMEISCVGPRAEQVHDALDELLVDSGAMDVVTTWHESDDDACEYFLFAAAGGRPTGRLALVADHADLQRRLEQMATAG